MENQTPNLIEIQERIKSGDVEAAQAFINNPESFEIPTSEAPEPMVETPEVSEVDMVTIEPQDVPTEPTEDVEQEEFINPLDEQRQIVDELEREKLEKEKALRAEIEAQKEEARQREEALHKQLEEARIAAEKAKAAEEVEEFNFFEEADSGEPVAEATAPVSEVPNETDNELLTRLQKLEQEQKEQKLRDEERLYKDQANRDYTSFWNSPEGEKLRPKGMDAETAIQKLDDVYYKLLDKFGSDVDAKRVLYDLRNPETAKIYEERAGIDLPDEYEKLYDTWAVRLYMNGEKLDPVTGQIRKTNTRLESMEDAYFLMNKQKMLFDAKMESFKQIQNKVAEHQEAARIPDPSSMQSFDSSNRIMDSSYRNNLLTNLKKMGYKMGAPLSTIRDVEIRKQAEELFNFAKQ